MKKAGLILSAIFITTSLFGQDITGQWNGALKFQGIQLRLVFHITKSGNGYTSTMDSPDQGVKGIPVTYTSFDSLTLKIEVSNAGIAYEGQLKKGGEIIGTFKQRGAAVPMNLSRTAIEKEIIKRPQDPIKPYSYYTENVSFQNSKANISLAGTLSLPQKEGNYPVVILISGSGPQTRDEEILGHKPFLVIADYLTKNGIAVLRYDDRGVGHSKGDFQTATTADFATDAESAIAFLKTRREINKSKIGLIGHSEGGIIAPMVAAHSKDVSFIILLAGTGIRGDQLLLLQQELIQKASGVSEKDIQQFIQIHRKIFNIVIHSNDDQELKVELENVVRETLKADSSFKIPAGKTENEFINDQVKEITSPWMLYFIKYEPATSLEKVSCPVLALNGGKDLQVPAEVNLTAIKNALNKGGNNKVTIKEFPNLNHLFQDANTGSPDEYAQIEQTFSPVVLAEITKWIINQTR